MSSLRPKTSIFALVLFVCVFAFAFLLVSHLVKFWLIVPHEGHFLYGLNNFEISTGIFPFKFFSPFFPPLILLFFWVLVSVWVYNDAEKKNMSGILWGLLVFVGNIIGLIIYLIVRSGTLASATNVPALQKKCPSCAQSIREDFKLCPHCGTNLKNECPKCSKYVESDWKVCPYCGTSLKK
jgi:RNA polymerase subunit RPABC4/transcription elongation factor Spt4